MLNLSENRYYQTVIRPTKKSIQHYITGKCQIERISFSNNHQQLEYSIQQSKALEEYKIKYPYTNPFSIEQCQHLSQVKNITDSNSKHHLLKIVKQLHCTIFSLLYIQKLKGQKYSIKNTRHQQQLLSLWFNLKPNQPLKSRCSHQWITIGFQTSDPASDFRGAGALGLLNLWKFSTKSKGAEAFRLATHPQTGFFFCSAGLFFTILVYHLLKNRKISYEYWVHNNEQQIITKFQAIYETLFKYFTKLWFPKCLNKQFIYLNQNLKKFQQEVNTWSPKVINALIQVQ